MNDYHLHHIDANVMIRMRDEVELATDIYLPTTNGSNAEDPLPVLLHRTPYDKSSERFVDTAKYFVSAGYVVVVQDVRGRYRSGGVFSKYKSEAFDGYDTVEWITRQPFAGPKVGMWGTSYGAHTQADIAKLNHPNLATIIVNMGAMANGWEYKIRNHGAFELQQQTVWAFRQAAMESKDPVVQESLQQESVEAWITAMPLRKGLNALSVAPQYEDFLLEMMTQGNYDDWRQIGTCWADYYEETSDIPMLFVSGWYDSYAQATVSNYLALHRLKESPIRLIMGPWIHGGQLSTSAGEVEFGPTAALDGFEREFHVRWYDNFIKGLPNTLDAEPPVKVFVMGTGEGHRDENGRLYHGGYWRSESEWPIPGTSFERYYLHGDGTLSPELPNGSYKGTTFTYDPRRPVPTIGGSFNGTNPKLADPGPWNQREREGKLACRPPFLPLKARPDVVVFQTDPLEEDVEIIGPVVVNLYISSSVIDTDFTAKLIDVYPQSPSYPTGFEMNVTDGIIRARYRTSPNKQEMMKPGEVYELTITPFPTANRFKKGHHIRIDISSSNFPRFDANRNTGEPLGRERRWSVAENTIHHCPEYPSHVVLPIVPLSSH